MFQVPLQASLRRWVVSTWGFYQPFFSTWDSPPPNRLTSRQMTGTCWESRTGHKICVGSHWGATFCGSVHTHLHQNIVRSWHRQPQKKLTSIFYVKIWVILCELDFFRLWSHLVSSPVSTRHKLVFVYFTGARYGFGSKGVLRNSFGYCEPCTWWVSLFCAAKWNVIVWHTLIS